MKSKDLKNFIGASAFIGSMLISCGRVGLPVSSKTEDKTILPKKEQKHDIENDQRMCQKYQKMYADSIRFANGYDSICNKSNMLWRKTAELESRADSLAMENSLGAVMQREVESAANKILKDFLNSVSGVLRMYQISLQDYVTEDNDFLWRFNTNVQKDNYDGTDYVLKQPLMYFGVNTCGFYDSEHEFNELVDIINQIIYESDHAKSHKKEIMNKINALIKKVKPKLIASRKSIERKYSDYYVVIDGQDAAFISYGADDWNYGYTDTEYPERQAVVKVTTLSIYGKNLPVEFFEDKKAKYELIRLENNRWQVRKTSKRWLVENTEVFTDKGETSIQEYYAGIDARNYSEFRFDPEHDSGGVHIEVEEGVVIKKAKRQWGPSRKVIHQIDSLEDESRKIAHQAAELEEQKKIINQYADSVARAMVNQHCK